MVILVYRVSAWLIWGDAKSDNDATTLQIMNSILNDFTAEANQHILTN